MDTIFLLECVIFDIDLYMLYNYFILCPRKVSWGHIQVLAEDEASGPSFDFLTSNFGGLLPSGRIPLATPASASASAPAVGDACLPLAHLDRDPTATAAAVLVTRGNCPFDAKAIHVQEAGGNVMVIEDPMDRSLQRIGAAHPLDGYVGIPSIAISQQCSNYIRELSAANKKISILLNGTFY